MTIPPKPFDPARAHPLLLLAPSVSLRAWESLANRERCIVSRLEVAATPESIRAARADACRNYPIDAGRVFLIGAAGTALGAEISADTIGIEPTEWPGLLARRAAPPLPVSTALRINVEKLRSAKGRVLAALYRSEKAFGKPVEALVALGTPTAEGNAIVAFSALSPGEFAVLLFHDENENGKLDTGLFGIPKEGYGASNDPKMRMGPPRWREARFLLTGASAERDFSIRLRYP